MDKGRGIEQRSFEIITSEMKNKEFKEWELPLVIRVIHATGDFDFEDNLRFHPDAVEAGIRALNAGKNILVDVNMVSSGISRTLLNRFGGDVICRISQVGEYAIKEGKTRAESAVEEAVHENIGIVAIGNAPTAMLKVMELIDQGEFNPDLVIGVPVGFVSAVESKDILSTKPYPFITSLGRKGGSPVAVAIINGILRLGEGYPFCQYNPV